MAARPISRVGLELCSHGGAWLWFYHPRLSPSPRETTGYPKARVPGMLEELLRAAAPSAEGEAAEGAAAGAGNSTASLSTASDDNAARRTTTLSCRACSSRVGQDPGWCALPGKDGHLPEVLAYCMACSGKAARKDPEKRRACCRRGFKTSSTLGKVHGRHWPLPAEETLPPMPTVVELVASSALGGNHPLHWAARAANLRDAEARRSNPADAARHVGVISLLHDTHAQEGGAMDPKVPGARPGRPPKEDSGISVTAKMLRGQLPSPTLNHEQKHVERQLEDLAAAGEAARFSHDLASGARPLSEALAQAEPWLSTAPPQPAAGIGAHAARQQRADRNEAANKQQQKEHAIRLKLVQAMRRREDVKRRVQSQYCVRGRAGVQKNAGVSRAAPPDSEMQMLFAELETEEKEVARQEAELAKARATTLAGPAGAALRSQVAGASSSGAQQRVTDSLASTAKLGDYVLIDAGKDNRYADGAKIDGRQRRYYLLRVTGRPRVLHVPLKNDWGTLQPGDHVLDGEYYYLVYKAHPTNSISARWYTTGQPPRHATGVPTHLLLCAGFAMPLAVLGRTPSKQQRNAVERGAIVLPEDVHMRALTALRQRP